MASNSGFPQAMSHVAVLLVSVPSGRKGRSPTTPAEKMKRTEKVNGVEGDH
jgi:hypothetical protein